MAGKRTKLPTSSSDADTAARSTRGNAREGASFPVPPSHEGLPIDYVAVLNEIKDRIHTERLRATLAANAAMVLMYWEIGRIILVRQKDEGWGAKVIDRLSADLRDAFPDMRGLSPRNLKYMRAFAAAWRDRTIVQEALAQIPWYHHIALMEKCRDAGERLWYARQTLANGWSHNILCLQIDRHLFKRQGKSVSNFALTLPSHDSDMAAQVFKDPYLFDFIGTADPRREREVERALVDHVQKFLLELGAGFAFVGRQVHLEFSSADYYLDLLFYHLKLRCYVVVELKAVPFEPEFIGKLNMYMGAVDDLLRHPDDKPTIGLLLCKGKDRIVAEYALSGFTRPIGVADWKKQLTEKVPAELRGSLPTVEEIEAELRTVFEQTGKRTRRGTSGGTVREAHAPYGAERVLIVDRPFDADDGADTPFGRRWEGGTITLTSEHLAALKNGKTLALDIRDEYVTFVKAADAKGRRLKRPKRGRHGG